MSLLVPGYVVQRRVDVGRAARENEGIYLGNLIGKLRLREFEGNGNGLAFCLFDGGEVILELVRNVLLFFPGSAPGDANAGMMGCTERGVGERHRTSNRSIRVEGRQPG